MTRKLGPVQTRLLERLKEGPLRRDTTVRMSKRGQEISMRTHKRWAEGWKRETVASLVRRGLAEYIEGDIPSLFGGKTRGAVGVRLAKEDTP